MPSNRTKYSEEMRTETAAYIIESGRSATSVEGHPEKWTLENPELTFSFCPRNRIRFRI